MTILNVEIKARCIDPERIKKLLSEAGAVVKGVDHQIDTYYNVPSGRLKLRQGSIETNLIHYERSNQAGPKASHVHLYKPSESAALNATLTAALSVMVVVDKQREISFIDNVKFHVDEVQGLGSFVEIEAIQSPNKSTQDELLAQCQHYLNYLQISDEDLIESSYSDLLMNLNKAIP